MMTAELPSVSPRQEAHLEIEHERHASLPGEIIRDITQRERAFVNAGRNVARERLVEQKMALYFYEIIVKAMKSHDSAGMTSLLAAMRQQLGIRGNETLAQGLVCVDVWIDQIRLGDRDEARNSRALLKEFIDSVDALLNLTPGQIATSKVRVAGFWNGISAILIETNDKHTLEMLVRATRRMLNGHQNTSLLSVVNTAQTLLDQWNGLTEVRP